MFTVELKLENEADITSGTQRQLVPKLDLLKEAVGWVLFLRHGSCPAHSI
jgi:hypothetical protein